MEKLTDPANSLTEIQRRSGVTILIAQTDASYSTTRREPYAEHYRRYTGLLDSAIEELQRAAQDEMARREAAAD